jgi:hypothetical protein
MIPLDMEGAGAAFGRLLASWGLTTDSTIFLVIVITITVTVSLYMLRRQRNQARAAAAGWKRKCDLLELQAKSYSSIPPAQASPAPSAPCSAPPGGDIETTLTIHRTVPYEIKGEIPVTLRLPITLSLDAELDRAVNNHRVDPAAPTSTPPAADPAVVPPAAAQSSTSTATPAEVPAVPNQPDAPAGPDPAAAGSNPAAAAAPPNKPEPRNGKALLVAVAGILKAGDQKT